MRKLLRVGRDIVRLARPYLASDDRRAAWILIAAIVALTLLANALALALSYSQRLFYSALQERHAHAFLTALFFFTPRPGRLPVPPFILFATADIATNCLALYLRGVLQLRWQRWLTTRLVDRWLTDRNYYRLRLGLGADNAAADNPDQRIQEDVEDATRNTIEFAAGLLTAVASVISFGGLLWALSGSFSVAGIAIPGSLLWFALGYAALCTAVAHVAGRRIARLNFVRQRFRGDFRVSLVNVRENAEEIAFLRGERTEAVAIGERFRRYWDVALRLLARNTGLTFLSNVTEQLAIVFPTVIAAPRFFSGQISFGTLNQIRLGFFQLGVSALWFVTTYAALANYVSQLERLALLQEALDRVPPPLPAEADGAATIAVTHVRAPGDKGRTLIGSVALSVPRGVSTAITGPSGSGKTLLLRLLAGLWSAEGRVETPRNAAFVPQRSYLPAGTLRRALCYPADPASIADGKQRAILATVGLEGLAASLDEEADWGARLSPGERARLALARAALGRPDWLFLDEPTAALDDAGRERYTAALLALLPEATVVIVTHDVALAARQKETLSVPAKNTVAG